MNRYLRIAVVVLLTLATNSCVEPLVVANYTCELSPSFCNFLTQAISALRNHSDETCQELGDDAWDRLQHASYGYVEAEPGETDDAYVKMTQVGGVWTPVNGNVYVNEGQWSSATLEDMANLLAAHEEKRHDGWAPDHSDGEEPECPLVET